MLYPLSYGRVMPETDSLSAPACRFCEVFDSRLAGVQNRS